MKRILFHYFIIAAAILIVKAKTFSQETSQADVKRAAQARLECTPHADQGNGYYRNLILTGPGADNSIVRAGKDFYMISGGNSSFTLTENDRQTTAYTTGQVWRVTFTWDDAGRSLSWKAEWPYRDKYIFKKMKVTVFYAGSVVA